MIRSLPLFVLLALGGCLEPSPIPEETDTDTDTDVDTDVEEEITYRGGTLYSAPMLLNWEWMSVESEEVCVSLVVENLGPDALGWRMRLLTDARIGSLRFFGAGVTAENNPSHLVIENPHEPLDNGETAEVIVCGSPRFGIDSILETEFILPEEPPDPPDRIAGSILDPTEQFLLTYEQNGRANNGDCMDLAVHNLAVHSFERFNLDLTFPDPVEIKLHSGLPANSTDNSSKVRIWPGPGDVPLHPWERITGQLCIDVAQHPGSMRANDVKVYVWPDEE